MSQASATGVATPDICQRLAEFDWPFIKEVKDIFKGHIQGLQVRAHCNFDYSQDAIQFIIHFHWMGQKKIQVQCLKTFFGDDQSKEMYNPAYEDVYMHPGSVYFGCLLKVLEGLWVDDAQAMAMYAESVIQQFNAHKADIVTRITNKSVYGTQEEPKWDQSSQSAASSEAAKGQSETSSSMSTDSPKSLLQDP